MSGATLVSNLFSNTTRKSNKYNRVVYEIIKNKKGNTERSHKLASRFAEHFQRERVVRNSGLIVVLVACEIRGSCRRRRYSLFLDDWHLVAIVGRIDNLNAETLLSLGYDVNLKVENVIGSERRRALLDGIDKTAALRTWAVHDSIVWKIAGEKAIGNVEWDLSVFVSMWRLPAAISTQTSGLSRALLWVTVEAVVICNRVADGIVQGVRCCCIQRCQTHTYFN